MVLELSSSVMWLRCTLVRVMVHWGRAVTALVGVKITVFGGIRGPMWGSLGEARMVVWLCPYIC